MFISRLEQYIGKKFKYEIIDQVIKAYIDNEVYYVYDCINMKVDMYERNVKTELGIWGNEKVSKANFAMLMRNAFKNGKDDILPYELEQCDGLEKLRLIFEKYLNKEYYSIGSVQTGKVSLVLQDNYEILYGAGNQTYSIDGDSDEEYIFSRFYYEVTYYTSFMRNLKDYETIFNEKFSEEEIISLIGWRL